MLPHEPSLSDGNGDLGGGAERWRKNVFDHLPISAPLRLIRKIRENPCVSHHHAWLVVNSGLTPYPRLSVCHLPQSAVGVALLLGFTLRYVGVGVGLPDYADPRESLIAQDILNLIHLKAAPEIFNWPGTAWFYLVAGVGKVLTLFGFEPTTPNVIWLARYINTFLSTATLWLTYRVAVHSYSRAVGLVAVMLLAVSMLHATNESRFALVDVPATFCVTLMLLLCTQAMRLTFRRTVLIGVVGGVGLAVKYTTVFAGLGVLPLLASTRNEGWRWGTTRLLTAIGVGAATFTILCPYWLIDLFSANWNVFFDALRYESSHYHRGHFGLFATKDTGWAERYAYLWTLLRWGLGWPLALLGVIGGLVAVAKWQRADGVLLAFLVPYLLFVGAHKLKFARHLILIYPVLALLGAATITRFSAKGIYQETRKDRKPGNSFFFFSWLPSFLASLEVFFLLPAIGVVCLYSFIYCAAFASVMTHLPTMASAAAWIDENIPPDEPVEQEPEVLFSWLLPQIDRTDDDLNAEWAIVTMPNAEVFLNYAARPDAYSPVDWYPLENVEPEAALAFYDRVFAEKGGYELVQVFKQQPRFLGIGISDDGAPFPLRALLHPEIRLYRLRSQEGHGAKLPTESTEDFSFRNPKSEIE